MSKMREIKFRAWEIPSKKMVYFPKLGVMKDIDTGSDDLMLGVIEHLSGYEGINYFLHKEDTELMQYTGLKDKNNKEIYEEDIMKWGKKIFVVKWSKTSAYFEGRYIDVGYDLLCNCSRGGEIIGNIYKNPELLKNK